MIIYARAKAFTREPVKENCFLVEGDNVRVYDNIAGYFTACHALSKRTERRIVKLAKELRGVGSNPTT